MSTSQDAKPRRADVVVMAVRESVPKSEVKLRARLKKIADDHGFQPPESTKTWVDLRNCLEDMIGPPTLPWHHAVIEAVQHHPGQESAD
jgi:hypothetical protein